MYGYSCFSQCHLSDLPIQLLFIHSFVHLQTYSSIFHLPLTHRFMRLFDSSFDRSTAHYNPPSYSSINTHHPFNTPLQPTLSSYFTHLSNTPIHPSDPPIYSTHPSTPTHPSTHPIQPSTPLTHPLHSPIHVTHPSTNPIHPSTQPTHPPPPGRGTRIIIHKHIIPSLSDINSRLLSSFMSALYSSLSPLGLILAWGVQTGGIFGRVVFGGVVFVGGVFVGGGFFNGDGACFIGLSP